MQKLKLRFIALFWLIFVIAPVSDVAQTPQPAMLPLVVLDEKKQFFLDLKDSDIQIRLDGNLLPTASMERKSDVKLEIVFMIDASVSQEKVLPFAKQIVRQLIDSVLKTQQDRVAVVRFSGNAETYSELTQNFAEAKNKLDEIEIKIPPGFVGGGIVIGSPPPANSAQAKEFSTSIWDSVEQTAKMNFSNAANTSKVILLITDGEDTGSVKKRKDAVHAAVKAGISVYAIGLTDTHYHAVNKNALEDIAEQTGGKFFAPKKSQDVLEVLKQIETALRSKYEFKFIPATPAKNGAPSEIKIEIVNPELKRRKIELLYARKFPAMR